MKFQAPAVLMSISYTKDGGLRLGFSTNELSDDDKVLVTRYHGQFGWVMFQPNEFQPDDIPKEAAEEGSKTPSRRLRSVLFRLWKMEGGEGDFDVWYRKQMEVFIGVVKKKLDDEGIEL